MKKILYISYDGLTDPLGQSQILPYLTELSKLGYEISILSAEKSVNFEKRESIIREIVRHNRLHWEHISYTKYPAVLSTLLDIRRLRRKARQMHKNRGYQIVHCRSYIASIIGLEMKQKYRLKFIFDMRGFWADERIDGGIWSLRNPIFKQIYHYFKQKEKSFLQKADYTISLTENAKTEIERWRLPQLAPIQVIPCCVDTKLFDPNLYPVEPPSKDTLTLSYLGSIGTWYMLEEMLIFFQQLLRFYPEAHFLFITTEPPETILSTARNLDIPEYALTIQAAERIQVPGLLAQSQLSIFFIKPYFSKKASSATKMGEILAMGIPIISNTEVGDHDFLFRKYKCGALLDLNPEQSQEEKQKAYEATIKDLKRWLRASPGRLRSAAIDYFGLEEGVKRYQQVYETLLR